MLAVRITKGLSKSREELTGCGPTQPRRRQGGGERGRLGPKDRIPYRTANRPPVSNQRPPEILDGRHSPGGRVVARHRAQAGTGAGDAEGRRRAAPGRARPSSPWLPEPLGRGRHKKQARLFVPGFCGTPRAGTARSAGHAPHRTAGNLSSVDGKAAPVPPRSSRELAT